MWPFSLFLDFVFCPVYLYGEEWWVFGLSELN